MRVLTVRQPWAWAIIYGGKSPENRTRNIAGSYRGPVAIHSASRYVDDWEVAADAIENITGEAIPPFECGHGSEVLGAVIGVVDLTGVHTSRDSHTASRLGQPVCFDNHTPIGQRCSPWAMSGHQHLVVTKPRPLATPIPAKGRLGLWTPGDELRAQIEEQLRVVAP